MPITRSPRKTGVATVRSLIWPAVIHGSLVSSTSPGVERLGREGRDDVPRAGGHRVDVAGRAAVRLAEHPARAVEDAAREVLGLAHDRGERGAHERRLLLVEDRGEPARGDPDGHGIERHAVTSMIRLPSSATRAVAPGADDGGGLALLDDRRALDLRARAHPVAVVDRGGDVGVVEVHVARALLRVAVAGRRRDEPQVGVRAAGEHAPADRLDRHVRALAAVRAHVRRLERGLEVLAGLDRDRDLEALADVAHVDRALVRDRRSTPECGQDRGALLLELGEQRLDRARACRRRPARRGCARRRWPAARRARRRCSSRPPRRARSRSWCRARRRRRTRAPARRRRTRTAAGRWRRGRARRRARARRWPCPR